MTLVDLLCPDTLEDTKPAEPDVPLVRVRPAKDMEAATMAVMGVGPRDVADAERVRGAVVLGFVYVADVDLDRRKVKILAPVSGRLGDRPLVWGSWPQALFNLLA